MSLSIEERKALRRRLAATLPDKDQARRICQDASLNLATINLEGTPESRWAAILEEVERQGLEQLRRLLEECWRAARALQPVIEPIWKAHLPGTALPAPAGTPPASDSAPQITEPRVEEEPAARRVSGPILFATGVLGLCMLVVIALIRPEVSAFQYQVFRVVLALAAAGFASQLPGKLQVRLSSGTVGVGTLGVFLLVYSVAPTPLESALAQLYRIHVTVLSSRGVPVDNAQLTASPSGVVKQVPGGWEVEVARDVLPADGQLTLFAARPVYFERGRLAVSLGEDERPAVQLELKRDRSAPLQGRVVTLDGRPVVGARVQLLGQSSGATHTDDRGQFRLAASAATGESVRVQVETSEGERLEDYYQAGEEPVTIVLHGGER